jgi:hypothetical protein
VPFVLSGLSEVWNIETSNEHIAASLFL